MKFCTPKHETSNSPSLLLALLYRFSWYSRPVGPLPPTNWCQEAVVACIESVVDLLWKIQPDFRKEFSKLWQATSGVIHTGRRQLKSLTLRTDAVVMMVACVDIWEEEWVCLLYDWDEHLSLSLSSTKRKFD